MMETANANAAENIRVVCRIRPMSEAEKATGMQPCVRCLPDGQTVEVRDMYERHSFHFRRVFSEYATQEAIYDEVAQPVLEAITNGVNAAVIAYGQTGAGKTHTMAGISGSGSGGGGDGSSKGLVPRLLHSLYRCTKLDPNEEYHTAVSFIQIYKENILDMLSDAKQCQIREDRNRGLWVTDALAVPTYSAEEVAAIMAQGEKNRVVAATKMNEFSSRSHSVMLISVSKFTLSERVEKLAQLYLVDLAGSESVDKTESEGERLEEAKHINQSLFALRHVISHLTANKPHVPYRDSKLTRLLQNSFGGNSKTTLIVCCSPSAYNARETRSTLRFGESTSTIKNRPVENIHRSADELTKLIKHTNTQIAEAREQIEQLKELLLERGVKVSIPTDGLEGLHRVRSVLDEDYVQELPHAFRCPLSGKVMLNPVLAADGYTYDEASIMAYLQREGHTPTIHGLPGIADGTLVRNLALLKQITEYNMSLHQ